MALELWEAVRKRKIEAELGIAEDPAEAAKKAKTTVPMVIRRYINDGFPDKKGGTAATPRHGLIAKED